MHLLNLSFLYLLVLIQITNGLICVSCLGSSNSGCNDPYNPSTSGDIPVPYNNYCAKVVYSTYVERMAGGRSCTSGNSTGGGFVYCCSNKDYCNGTTRHISSMIFNLSMMIFLMVLKRMILF
ncbi:unnamed protein product [Rotaria sp. Silwood1]|nr:unnamed protein product [Rotaria sp. Silwood1]CAF3456566.1 unnamed protein product [Rotaria sp. Silwood1]CAF3480211.1 unnamed protein product [Rotaria sp. Silwood1]CAF3493930.1 unnamed protein product [Rotaria sp. Silwood1]CAF4754494.1 unnamed protein product [Rotaria sp. Silwood1]